MEKTTVFALLVVVITINSLMVEGLDEATKQECQKFAKRTLKKFLKKFNECNKELKLHHISGEEFQKKVGCVVKCVMKKVDLLDDKEMLTADTLKSAIEIHLPVELQAAAHETLIGCVNEKKLDPADENCKSYLEMGTCMQGAVSEACGEITPI